jgi:hypothetical protein
MNGTRLILVLFLISLPTVHARGQDDNATQVKNTLAMVRLLPGYKFQFAPGIEGGGGGTIWKEKGPKIEFRIDVYLDVAAWTPRVEDVLWKEEQVVNGQTLICMYTKRQELFMSFPEKAAYFRAKVQNQEILSEVLLMVVTFDIEHGYPVDPAMVVPVPKNPKSIKNPAN